MLKFECRGVKCTAIYNGVLRDRLSVLQLPGIDKLSTIHIIGDDRVLYVRQMDAYLMGSAGLGCQLEKREAAKWFDDLVEGNCLFSDFRSDRVFLSYLWVDAQWCAYAVGCQVRGPVDNSEIVFFDMTAFELFSNFPLGSVVFGNDHNTGGVSVETMDDAGAKVTQPARQLI